MEIFIEDIPEEGLDISASEADVWLKKVIHDAVGDAFGKNDHAKLRLTLHRFENNVSIDGDLKFSSHPDCDRCLKNYEEPTKVLLHEILAPLYENKKQKEMEERMEVELVKDDLEFSYYEGDRFDLDDMIREQITLAMPMKHLCKEDCLGLCQRCAKDLNEGPCGCKIDTIDPRWAPLKDLKSK